MEENLLVLDLGAPYISEFHSKNSGGSYNYSLRVGGKDDIGKRCLPPIFEYI